MIAKDNLNTYTEAAMMESAKGNQRAIVGALVATLIGLLSVCIFVATTRPNLGEKIERELSGRIGPGSPRQAVEKWISTQPEKYITVNKTLGYYNVLGGLNILGINADEFAGLKPSDVSYVMRGTYEERSATVYVYFYFDDSDHLIKHLVYRHVPSL